MLNVLEISFVYIQWQYERNLRVISVKQTFQEKTYLLVRLSAINSVDGDTLAWVSCHNHHHHTHPPYLMLMDSLKSCLHVGERETDISKSNSFLT